MGITSTGMVADGTAHYVFLSLAGLSLRPVLDVQSFEANEILVVRGCKDQPVDGSNRRDLAINERHRLSQPFEPCSLVTVPGRRRFVIRQDREGAVDDVAQIGLQGRATFPLRK